MVLKKLYVLFILPQLFETSATLYKCKDSRNCKIKHLSIERVKIWEFITNAISVYR